MTNGTQPNPGLWTRFWAAIWRFFVIVQRVLIVLFILLPVLVISYSWFAAPRFEIENGIAMVWAPYGVVLERSELDPGEVIAEQLFGEAPSYSIQRELLESLALAAGDPRIKAVFLKLDELEYAGMAQLEELARAIADFKHSGKPVYVYSGDYNQQQYFLAAQADKVMLDPLGGLWIEGFDFYQQYFKDALDKLGVDVHIFRAGIYKSAVEPFERNDMSADARAANQAWLDVQWDTYVQGVAAARGLSADVVRDYAGRLPERMVELLGDNAALAKRAGLVDEIVTREQVREKMRQLVGADPEHGSFRQLDNQTYLRARKQEDRKRAPEHRIGFMVAQGALVDGESSRGTTGGDTLAWQIEEARRDESIDALVLRVDSPGGSVTAAEAIRRELELFRKAGKPVVVSMSSLAASGGYWIALESDRILASPSTLTGSIGVFGVVPTFDRPLGKLGIHTDGLGTTPVAGAYRVDRPLSPKISAALQSGVDFYYRQFVGRVSSARRLSVEAAAQMAEGRVWSGADAQRLGLTDQSGGLRDAIQVAAQLAELPEGSFEVTPLDAPQDWRSAVLDLFSMRLGGWLDGFSALEVTAIWAATRQQLGLDWLNDPRAVYSYCGCAGFAGSPRR